MKISGAKFFLLSPVVVVSLWGGHAFGADAPEAEIRRLRGFSEHQRNQAEFDREREKGEKDQIEENMAWEALKEKNLIQFKKIKAAEVLPDNSKDLAIDEAVKKEQAREYEVSRKEYSKSVQNFDRSKYKDLVTEDVELGLDAERPRYDLKKRALFGAQVRYGKVTTKPGTSSSSSGGGSPSYTPPSSFPPPPSTPPYDDFGDGYIPPPADGFGDDFPPPPPPPPPPIFEEDGFIPPPPPPPFSDEGMEF